MFIYDWIEHVPKADRFNVRKELAALCACSEITIRSYLNGNRTIPSHLFLIIEEFTNSFEFGGVSCRELAIDAAARSEKQLLSKAS
jgi:DNA-binding transcriptional regulator YdaS (Cro superfamily)